MASDSIPRALILSALTARYLSRMSSTPSMTGTERLRPHVPSPLTCCTNMVDLSPIRWTSLAYSCLDSCGLNPAAHPRMIATHPSRTCQLSVSLAREYTLSMTSSDSGSSFPLYACGFLFPYWTS